MYFIIFDVFFYIVIIENLIKSLERYMNISVVTNLTHHYKALVLMLLITLLIAGSANAAVLNQNKKVLIVVSSDKSGFWLPEVVEPYFLLEQSGFKMDIASPLGGKGKASGASRLSSKQNEWFLSSKLKKQLSESIPLNKVIAKNYSAVYFAGGSGPMFDLIDNKQAQKLTREIYENGGIVSADCHGPAALINVKLTNGKRLIEGKKITAKANVEEGFWARSNYPFLLEDKIKQLGGIYSAAKKSKPYVVIDGRLITGQNPASAIPMAKSLIVMLQSQK
jgi:putative intracellular protease/amidase